MYKWNAVFLIIVMIFISSSVSAGGISPTSPITYIQVSSSNGGTFVSNCTLSNGEPTNCITNPSCNSSKWFFIPKESLYHDAFMQVIIASKVSNSPIRLAGSGYCNAAPTIPVGQYETLLWLDFK